MRRKRERRYRILAFLLALVILGNQMMSVEVSAKTKTVKIYPFTSGDTQVDSKVCSVIKKKIKPKMTTAEKVKTIHDYIVLHCEYDYQNYCKGTIPYVDGTPRGVLINKKAVCQGYAVTFKLFMDALNIPCEVVWGSANNGSWGGHAWNVVCVDKKWYQIDVTWDDEIGIEKDYIRYAYFLIPDKKMDDDHRWDRNQYPKCNTSNNRFISLLGKVSKTMNQSTEKFYKDYKKSKKKESVLIVPKKLYKKPPRLRKDGKLWKRMDFIDTLHWNILIKYGREITKMEFMKCEYGDYYIIKTKVLKEHKFVW